jgi:hypothetical protein
MNPEYAKYAAHIKHPFSRELPFPPKHNIMLEELRSSLTPEMVIDAEGVFRLYNLRYNGKRFQLARTFIYIALGCYILHLLLVLLAFKYHLGWSGQGPAFAWKAGFYKGILQVFTALGWIIQVASAFFFINWFRRSFYNLKLRRFKYTRKDFWAVLCWFIPLVNFWLPFKLMEELYTHTEAFVCRKSFDYRGHADFTSIRLWQKHFILTLLCTLFLWSLFHYFELPYKFYLHLLANILNLVMVFYCIKHTLQVMKEYGGLEDEMFAEEFQPNKDLNSQVL